MIQHFNTIIPNELRHTPCHAVCVLLLGDSSEPTKAPKVSHYHYLSHCEMQLKARAVANRTASSIGFSLLKSSGCFHIFMLEDEITASLSCDKKKKDVKDNQTEELLFYWMCFAHQADDLMTADFITDNYINSHLSSIDDAFSEVQCTCEGDVHRLPEDRVPPGETGGPAACLPHKLLSLCSLQHKTQVSSSDCCIFFGLATCSRWSLPQFCTFCTLLNIIQSSHSIKSE